MSKFRELVEDIVHPQPVYNYLTPVLQKALDSQIQKAMDRIDISELPGAYYDSNPYDVEPQLVGTSGGWFIDDESEVWNAACDLVIEWIEADGASEYLWDYLTPEQQDDDEFGAALTKEAVSYIQAQKSN